MRRGVKREQASQVVAFESRAETFASPQSTAHRSESSGWKSYPSRVELRPSCCARSSMRSANSNEMQRNN
jgi:hypothetical protein